MLFKLLTDRLLIAICRSNWLHSRKYGTVLYHRASSRFYLTIFILCQFLGKIDWHASGFDARATCVKLANPACCVLGMGADFTSTICVSNFVWIASGQILHRSQGTILPTSVNPRYRISGINV
jgi:hypothetical protein